MAPPAPATTPLPAATWLARPVVADARTISNGTYIIQRGDTLHAIVRKSGVPLDVLVRENGLVAPYAIRAGQKLSIPGGRYHLVKGGETGIGIARAYGIPWSRIAAKNDLKEPYILREGQKLQLPSQQEAASMSLEQRAEAFKLNIDDIVTGGEPAIAADARPVPPEAAPGQPVAPTAPVAAPAVAFDGRFSWPVAGTIVRPFGLLGDGRRNDGINIAAARGTAIYAAADGVVAYAGTDVAIYGGLILIRHGEGWLTAYGHAERLQVARGQSVKKGQLIGYVAEAGLADQDQLHFEVRRGRTPVDPRLYLAKNG